MKVTIAKYTTVLGLFVSGAHYGSHGWQKLEVLAGQKLIELKQSAINTLIEQAEAPVVMDQVIEEQAHINGVSPGLIRAVIAQESDHDAEAMRTERSYLSKGYKPLYASSIGLMQVIPHKENMQTCGLERGSDLFNPVTNIECGSIILGRLANKYQSTEKALIAYNGGEGCVKKQCPQAVAYAKRVLDRFARTS